MEPVVRQVRQTVDGVSRVGNRSTVAAPAGVGNALSRRDLVVLVCLVFVGLLVRLDFMRAAGFAIDADEAIVGLMGKHILEGRGVPTFYYGQHYMGSLEAIMASASFALFGISPFTLQLVPLVCSLALIPLMFFLGKAVMSRATGLIAALLTAVPAPALIVWSSKARGGFIEIIVLGAVALLLTISWIRGSPDRLRYPIALGLILGFGWWVNNQIVYFIAPIGVFALIHAFSSSMRAVRRGTNRNGSRLLPGGVVKIAFVGLLAFFVGSLPYWIYNVRHGFPSLQMLSAAGGEGVLSHAKGLVQTALPMIVGAQRFWQKNPVFPGAQLLAFCLYALPIGWLLLMRRRELLALCFGRLDRRHPIELGILFSLTCCFVFSVSSFGWLVQAPRYLLPLYVGIYLLIAVVCGLLLERNRKMGMIYAAALVAFHVAAGYAGGRAVSGEPVVFGGQRVARDHEGLISALDSLGIHHVRTNYWIGYRLAFESRERVTFSVIGDPDVVRIPEYERDTNTGSLVTTPLVLVQAEANLVKPALQRQGFSFSELRAGGYTILYDLKDLFVVGPELALARGVDTLSGTGESDPWGAFDGDIHTRWSTASPQQPGQGFSITFSVPRVLSALRYDIGAWRSDLPRGLKIELEDALGERAVVLSPTEWRGLRHITMRHPEFTLRFMPRTVRRVILSQEGSDPVVDWSIAELELFQDRSVQVGSAG